MRALSILLLLLTTWPALAQTPDTTDAWRYVPLEVGNVWEYRSVMTQCDFDGEDCASWVNGWMRWRVVRRIEEEDETRYEFVQEGYDPDGNPTSELSYVVWYDTSTSRIESTNPIPISACPYDAPFDGVAVCGDGTYETSGGYGEEVIIGTDVVEASLKAYQKLVGSDQSNTFASDVGMVSLEWGEAPLFWSVSTLTYARIGDAEYGIPQFPVATEGAPESAAAALSVFPNPSRDAATVRFTLDRPQRVTLALYDVLGRRVLSRDLGAQPAGEATHRIDMTSLPTGVYIVCLDGDAGARATARIILQ